jgi:tetratricopeptide (TPR) repeat protein
MQDTSGAKVEMKRKPVSIPTYVPYPADRNPVFYEKRAYQGASGRIYPLPLTDRLRHEKTDKAYDSVTLENRYIKIMVLPEIGGRIHMGLDKTNDYHFIYHNRVIKPALIGIAGPWISGGIEFNWPQHHRPTTFMPLETALEENADGSRTVWVGEVEPLYRTKSMMGVTVYPDRSYVKVKVRAYNRTCFPQQFMWWANLGVHVNEDYRIIFPPDVGHVAFHDRAFVSGWPILKGIYAGNDFKDGVDGSWFKNHMEGGSFMVMDGTSGYDFIEGYDMGREAGVVHVADHHIAPGKKLFTWGNSEFAEGWRKNLTDNDGHYVELMTGVYTDNQPDFSWMQPNETRTFEQCWYPVRKIGIVRNATEDAAVSLEIGDSGIVSGYHATGRFEQASVVLKAGEETLLEKRIDIDPATPFLTSCPKPAGIEEHQVWTAIFTSGGRKLVEYRPLKTGPAGIPEARKPSPEPKEIREKEELYLHGLHIEQYRHHSLEAEDYFAEALKRDPGDIRCNNALGLLHLKKGKFESAESCFLKAKERLMSRNTNPYDGEALFHLGVSRKYLGKFEEAYDAFYKAAWNYAWKSAAYQMLAGLDCRGGDFEKAWDHINRALETNVECIRSRDLKAAILRKRQKPEDALALACATRELDRLDYWAGFEVYFAAKDLGKEKEASDSLRLISDTLLGKAEAYIDIAIEYADAGMLNEADFVLETYLESCKPGKASPMAYYHLGDLSLQRGNREKAAEYFRMGEQMPTDYCFPSRLEAIGVLEAAGKLNPWGARAFYYLGNLMYDKGRAEEAVESWEKARKLDGDFAIVHRNLALAYFDKKKDPMRARTFMEKAFQLNDRDSRLLYELLQLYKNSNEVSVEERLALLEGRDSLVQERNDLYTEMLVLLLQKGRFAEAAQKLGDHVYDIYEGGEGKLVRIHDWVHILLGLEKLKAGEAGQTLEEIRNAAALPEYYHEGRHHAMGTPQLDFYAGMAAEAAGRAEEALRQYKIASGYHGWMSDAVFYKGLAFRRLGMEEEAHKAFESLIAEGDSLMERAGTYGFFATGVPTAPPFENNRKKRSMSEGFYLKGLGYIGLGMEEEGLEELQKVFAWDANHLGAWIHSGKSGDLLRWIRR